VKAGRCRCFKHGASSRLDWDARLTPSNAVARARALSPANMTDRNCRRPADGTRPIGVSTVGVSGRASMWRGYRPRNGVSLQRCRRRSDEFPPYRRLLRSSGPWLPASVSGYGRDVRTNQVRTASVWLGTLLAVLMIGARPAHADSVVQLFGSYQQSLAARVERDAKRGGHGGQTFVQINPGLAVYRVIYRARSGKLAKYGAYEVRLEVIRGEPQKLNVLMFSEPHNFALAQVPRLNNFGESPGHGIYDFNSLVLAFPRLIRLDYSGRVEQYSVEPVTPRSEEARLTTPEVQELFGQALQIVAKAEHHAPLTVPKVLSPGLP